MSSIVDTNIFFFFLFIYSSVLLYLIYLIVSLKYVIVKNFRFQIGGPTMDKMHEFTRNYTTRKKKKHRTEENSPSCWLILVVYRRDEDIIYFISFFSIYK